ncbi:hypothetical protein LOZ12_004649 [Ophidiomyces ophidiicola]|uniref:Uncharacterized protein n=1 Tax=Ophidiomyces ophidiicola TaxID=1387563 RepID=A0ACB8USK8_9EURO|nr:uncharacterized protein LOZ57_004199 [Ophidiomyces ophidiicola]KAI1910429.1 hypothetical protein LOZ64_004951 [Ophidiomyces ophidiicola]KAI1915598.1 hypothetical protein LOZ61_001529 [Ophidiomyces ophidiicola]KAI1927311.1 hypothetical protein LOZ60_003191 [Ophidiomyces ophidiicola]KAI1943130.1 hypothetical protein LOZ62_004375 [Ophidiomyces ophidiicola]KAI1945512.1 hypothetical protein LOZ57_004199 [Ophidiomyces ophidiicola]
MPAPLAKGIVITISVLVAAGIAVYENPQIQEWLETSRRKIAMAISSWGEELNPYHSESREDISMTEELGDEAELRRRRIREDIQRRREILESSKRRKSTASCASFSTLVDSEGRLKSLKESDNSNSPVSRSTGVDITAVETVNRILDRSSVASPSSSSKIQLRINSQQELEVLEDIVRHRLPIPPMSEVSSDHPSESLVGLTPTSEFLGSEMPLSLESLPEQIWDRFLPPINNLTASSVSSHTEDDFVYTHPDLLNGGSISPPPTDFENVWHHDVSSTPSIASSASHIQNETFEIMSEGTLSDLGGDLGNSFTPTSWSEVGSVISSNDENHQ